MDESLDKKRRELLDRMRKGSFPPAAIAGALVSFASEALGVQRKPKEGGSANPPHVQAEKLEANAGAVLALEYAHSSSLEPKWRRSLSGISIGSADTIFVLGDGEVRIFERNGTAVRSWKAPENASCIAVGHDGRVYFGVAGHIEIYSSAGLRNQGFDAGEAGRQADITAMRILPKEILAADAVARCIRRYDHVGRRLGEVGNQDRTRGFMLPNRSLDFDIDSNGVIIAADSGRHRVSSWTLDGKPIRHFGKFGIWNPEDFVGCCNPVNLAFAPAGRIVTAEKVVPRVKVYDTEGKLLGLIGPEHFDSKCTHLHLAADSKGRILVADPVRLEVKIFSVKVKPGGNDAV